MRIRSVKPEFWRSPDTTGLDYFTRLFFIGLWNYVDDNGVGEDNINLIRSDLFPREPDIEEISLRIHGALTELSSKGQIVRYADSLSGRYYLHVSSWHHQKINRPTESTKPLPTSEYCVITEGSLNPHGAITEGSLLEGIKGSGNKGGENRPTRFCPKHPDGTDKPCWACKRCREEDDLRRAQEQRAAIEALENRRRREANCHTCRGTNWIPDTDPAVKCNHQEAVNG